MSLGTGLGKLAGKVFRIGHLGDFNDLTLMGTLAGCEMGLQLAGVPVKKEGVQAAMDYLAECRASRRRARQPESHEEETSMLKTISCQLPPALLAVPAAAGRRRPIPTKPVRMIVGFPPGGGTDVVARVIGAEAAPNGGASR